MSSPIRECWHIEGVVQGVGFRPFVARLARDCGLTGWVSNSPEGVELEIQGAPERIAAFRHRLPRDLPPHAVPAKMTRSPAPVTTREEDGFTIRPSRSAGEHRAGILPDLATCPHCLAEIRDPANRRFRYPFTNCTQCGPRYSILLQTPYDRPHTSMRAFTMCADCQREYEDPFDRRHHAQPNACPVCGPQLLWSDAAGTTCAARDEALAAAGEALAGGAIVAVKGLGGFHLMCDAAHDRAVRTLRDRKRRGDKPFAVMVPDLPHARRLAHLSAAEERALAGPTAPIVLVDRRPGGGLSPAIAPHQRSLGLMLPYTPLHHLLLADLNRPLVATSANISEDPICTDNADALHRLRDIADFFLLHNRPIVRPADDSILHIIDGRPALLRRARGYAPLPIAIAEPRAPALAAGPQQKNTVAVVRGRDVFLSPHNGDLDSPAARRAFEAACTDLPRLLHLEPGRVLCDAHPDYASTRWARTRHHPVRAVYHHAAHVAAALAEHGQETSPALGIAWDGTGYGEDGTVWGGEAFHWRNGTAERVGSLHPFPLPGGEAAVREPRRTAFGLLAALNHPAVRAPETLPAPLRGSIDPREARVWRGMIERGLNTPRTSSMGRLFDGVAALCGLRPTVDFEGQAAMELEAQLDPALPLPPPWPLPLLPPVPDSGRVWFMDWRPLVDNLLQELAVGAPIERVAGRFHAALIRAVPTMARQVGEPRVVLCGGCFQNRVLLSGAIEALRRNGFQPVWPERVPVNDGGIALGQIVLGAERKEG